MESKEGGCYCGEVRYRITQEPIYQTLCHCEDCRRINGAHAVAWFTVRPGGIEWLRGEPKRFQSSPPVERTFCGTCGTSLTYTHADRNGEIDITTGSLDDPEAFPPNNETYMGDKLSWA